ncbi:dihydropteroate synthase, partial [uncultured Duncaniella sp.]
MFTPFSLNIRGRLFEYDKPAVMGIVNVTPDSFFAGSRSSTIPEIAKRVEEMITAGADMLDLGAYSSRPGASDVSEEEECRRIALGMKVIRDISQDIPVSVDTFRAGVAREAVVNLGADIVNDISGGDL